MSTLFPQPTHGVVISISLLVAVLATGCDRSAAVKKSQAGPHGASAEHADHASHEGENHAQPENFAQGVRELKEHYMEIKKAFEEADAKKAIEQAHEPLHAVGEILEALPELGKQANLPPEDLRTLKKSVDTMFEDYGSVDGAVHAGKEPDYQAVAAKIDEAMAAIEAVNAQQGK